MITAMIITIWLVRLLTLNEENIFIFFKKTNLHIMEESKSELYATYY